MIPAFVNLVSLALLLETSWPGGTSKQREKKLDILEKLACDHVKQKELCQTLLATSGDTKQRRDTYEQLKTELVAHAAAEEMAFYSPLMSDVDGVEIARHSVAEHKDLDDLIKKVDDADIASSAWLQHFKNLAHKVEHHVDEEEADVFPVAKKLLSQQERDRIGAEFVDAKDKQKQQS